MIKGATINPYTVLRAVEEIDRRQLDYEAAHSMEDDMRAEVLRHIAQGTANNPQACARAALATDHLDFPRYCA